MEKFWRKYHAMFFLAVAGLLLYPTFQRGYIFLLDWTLTPEVSLADIRLWTDPLIVVIARLLSIGLGFAVWQRVLLFGTVFFAGMAGFRLAKRTGSLAARYFSGLLLIFNPFIYARLMEQSGIAAGSVALFWCLVFLLEYLEERMVRKLVGASVCAGLAVSFFPHSVFFVALSVSVISASEYFRRRDGRFFLKTMFVVFLAVVVMNGNWILAPAFGAGGTRAGAAAGFTDKDAEAFATRGIGGDSVYLTVIGLQGYWGEYQDRFVSVRENPLWFVAFVLIFALSVFGLVKRWKRDFIGRGMSVMFVTAFVLAVGVASPWFEPFVTFLHRHAPMYIGLREPQKWVAVLVFVYAYLGAWGVKYVSDIRRVQEYRKELMVFCALLPVMFSFSIIEGMHRHFTPHEFPAEWQEAKLYLEERGDDGKILFFPWHLYMDLDFAGKNVVVPAQAFFGEAVVQGNNTEFGGVYSHSLDDRTLIIERYVAEKIRSENMTAYNDFPDDMRSVGIHTVMLAKTEDWKKYLWLDRVNGISKALENDKLIIYVLQ